MRKTFLLLFASALSFVSCNKEGEIFGDGIGAKVPCFGESAVILVPTGEVAVFFGRVGGPVDRAPPGDAGDGSHIGAAVAVKGDGEGRGGFRGGGVIGV